LVGFRPEISSRYCTQHSVYSALIRASYVHLRYHRSPPCPVLKLKQSHHTPRRRLGGEEVWLLLILDFRTRWGWVVSVTPRSRFSSGEWTSGTHCRGGWVSPQSRSGHRGYRKYLFASAGGLTSIAGRQVRSQTLYWRSYPAHPHPVQFPLSCSLDIHRVNCQVF
jgi:hypothetical protein